MTIFHQHQEARQSESERKGHGWSRSIILKSAPSRWHPHFEMIVERVEQYGVDDDIDTYKVVVTLVSGPCKLTNLEFVLEEVAQPQNADKPIFRHSFILKEDWLRGQTKDLCVEQVDFKYLESGTFCYAWCFRLKVRPLHYGQLKQSDEDSENLRGVDLETGAGVSSPREGGTDGGHLVQVKVEAEGPDGADGKKEDGDEAARPGSAKEDGLRSRLDKSGMSTLLSFAGIASLKKANEKLNQEMDVIRRNMERFVDLDEESLDEDEDEDEYEERSRDVEITEESGGVDASNPLQQQLINKRSGYYQELLMENQCLTIRLEKMRRAARKRPNKIKSPSASDSARKRGRRLGRDTILRIQGEAQDEASSREEESSLASQVGSQSSSSKTIKCACGGQYSPSYFKRHQAKHCRLLGGRKSTDDL